MPKLKLSKELLEKLYNKYNKRNLVHPDPLEFLYNYKTLKDREIVGLIASSLAYGRVNQILKSVSIVLNRLGSSPYDFITTSTQKKISKTFTGFKHRFTTDEDISDLTIGIKNTLKKHGTLNRCFTSYLNNNDENVTSALNGFVNELTKRSKAHELRLLSRPEKGSACKRLNLFLRWMVRSDDVDPGEWRGIPKSKLIVPLDTHMYKIGKAFGFTKRKQANLKTASEISSAFAKFSPEDPTKYDFTLTRYGIRDDMDIDSFLSQF